MMNRRCADKRSEQGHVLLAALMVIVVLVLLSMALLNLAAQDAPSLSAMAEQTQAQHLAEGAADLVVSWFHEPSVAPASLSGLLMKRQETEAGPSFFDAAGRSQFSGTSERPDIFLEVTASTPGRRPLASTIRLQLGALTLPAIRSVVQTDQGLGVLKPGGASTIFSHWGDVRVMGDVVINRITDLVVKSASASVTGESYERPKTLEDRWVDYWIGGNVSSLSSAGTESVGIPSNVYMHQHPTPGVRLDRWDYDLLKKTAQRHGTYYRIDRDGRLHTLGAIESDPGRLPGEVLASAAVGQSHGLVFIDTLDAEAPGLDNLGTLMLDTDYVEALLVVQGHVHLKPSGVGRSVSVLSPPPEGSSALSGRVPVTLSGIHLNGLLYAAGTVTVERESRIYGAMIAGGAITAGPAVEIWYNSDFGKGLFRGLPVVYRAPSTWQLKY
jgi:hypothetical protein